MSTTIYFNLCKILNIEPSDPISDSVFNEMPSEDELICHGIPTNAFQSGHIPWNYGLTKDTNETIKNIGEKVSAARKKYYEDWHKNNVKKTYHKKGYENSAKAARERMLNLERLQLTCPKCGVFGESVNMKRWHFDNCKTQLKNCEHCNEIIPRQGIKDFMYQQKKYCNRKCYIESKRELRNN